MFRKALDTINNAIRSLGLKESPIESGRVIDTLSRESFPARPEIGASLDVDTAVFGMAIAIGPGNIPLNPSWQLRIKQPDGKTHTYWMSEEMRIRLLEDLRDQVAKHGQVTEVSLPRISTLPDAEHRA